MSQKKERDFFEYLKAFVLYYVLWNAVLTVVAVLGLFLFAQLSNVLEDDNTQKVFDVILQLLVIPGFWLVFAAGGYWFYSKKVKRLTSAALHIHLAAFLLLCAEIIVLGILTKGSFIGDYAMWALCPFFPMAVIAVLMLIVSQPLAYLMLFGILSVNVAVVYYCLYKKTVRKSLIAVFAVAVISASIGLITYANRPEAKYGGHGFDYMNGYSSTDFKDYMPYSDPSKLVILDHEASLVFEKESEFPVLDGAEACYPMYSSIAKNVYKNIGDIEKKYLGDRKNEINNGRYVTFTNSSAGYKRLLSGDVDIFFGARPSEYVLKEAEYEGKELEMIPIAREAFVFFAEDKNPVNDLSYEDIRKIYSGEITNWKEVGGKDQEIIAFQRPAESGSQIMMKYFMGDVPLKEPLTYEVFDSMGGIIDRVAQYHNEKGALGYTFRFFLEGLHQEDRVKMLSVNGVCPSVENIQNGSYPLVTDVYAVVLKTNYKISVRKLLDYLLSEEGQWIIGQSGYSPVQ